MPQPVMIGHTLVAGRSCSGPVYRTPPPHARGYIYVTQRLTPQEYPIIRRCKAIICGEGGTADHPAVICRIIGKPVVLVEAADPVLHEGEIITLNAYTGAIFKGRIPSKMLRRDERVAQSASAISQREVSLQVSIVDERDIIRANRNAVSRYAITQFFLREELVWATSNIDPFEYLKRHGIAAVSKFLQHRLQKCLRRLQPGQNLNYRSLDWRAEYAGVNGNKVGNRELGLHGIRQLLREPDLLVAELDAVDGLAQQGYDNIIFSLPFITECEELEAVQRIVRERCLAPIPLGIFIETAAAVSELPMLLSQGVACVYIGTKDLTQMILACDRSDPEVRYLYDCRKRPVVTAITQVLSACSQYSVPVVLFSFLEDIPFFLERFRKLSGVSICCGEYELLTNMP